MTLTVPSVEKATDTWSIDAYRNDPAVLEMRRPTKTVKRPCACKGIVEANPIDPTPGVRAHNATEQHGQWREANDL